MTRSNCWGIGCMMITWLSSGLYLMMQVWVIKWPVHRSRVEKVEDQHSAFSSHQFTRLSAYLDEANWCPHPWPSECRYRRSPRQCSRLRKGASGWLRWKRACRSRSRPGGWRGRSRTCTCPAWWSWTRDLWFWADSVSLCRACCALCPAGLSARSFCCPGTRSRSQSLWCLGWVGDKQRWIMNFDWRLVWVLGWLTGDLRGLKLDIDDEGERLLIVRVDDGLGGEHEELADFTALGRVVFGVWCVLDERFGTASSVAKDVGGEELREVVAVHRIRILWREHVLARGDPSYFYIPQKTGRLTRLDESS